MNELNELANEILGTEEPIQTFSPVLRQGTVTAIDHSATTCTVKIGGSGTGVSNVRWLGSYYPVTGDTVWLQVQGPMILILGSTRVPAFRMTKVGAGLTTVTVGAGGTSTIVGGVGLTVPSGPNSLCLIKYRGSIDVTGNSAGYIRIQESSNNSTYTTIDGGDIRWHSEGEAWQNEPFEFQAEYVVAGGNTHYFRVEGTNDALSTSSAIYRTNKIDVVAFQHY